MMRFLFALFITTGCVAFTASPCAAQNTNTADLRQNFIQQFCVDCHGPDKQKGDFRIDNFDNDLTDLKTREQWDLVLDNVEFEDMPTKKADRHPTAAQREAFLNTLKADMLAADQSASVGGTPLRRLNQIEYLNSLNDLINVRGFKLPNSFPADSSELPFDTMPQGLFLSAAALDAYLETATNVADLLVPLPNPTQVTKRTDAAAIGVDGSRKWMKKGDTAVYLTGSNISPWSGGIWVSDFKAHTPGMYRVRLLASAQAPTGADGKPLRFSFHLSNPLDYEIPRRALNRDHPSAATVEVPNTDTQWVECLVPVEQGEAIYAFCQNRFTEPAPEYATKGKLNAHVNAAKASNAPTLRVEAMEVTGPVAPLPRQVAFLQNQTPHASAAYLRSVLLPFAQRAYRRPLTPTEADALIAKSLDHVTNTSGGKISGVNNSGVLPPAFAVHYGVRRILTSPAFLYREATPGPLNDYDLAARLAYFLWSAPPDATLLDLASRNQLSRNNTLGAQIKRMIAAPRSEQFIKHFAGQWLETRRTQNLMVCDIRYEWSEMIRHGFIRSTELFLAEILRNNLPITTFIDSDFIYANEPMLQSWGLPVQTSISQHEANQRHYMAYPPIKRIELNSLNTPKHSRLGTRGGILGLPSVLAATGDGVESSPILRGVWVLENFFGTPPPPPPANVPAIDVDISKANTLREILTAHKENESCAKCHRKIDPIGLALENYDAIGGWRTRYKELYTTQPKANDKSTDLPVDPSGTLPDGAPLHGPDDIKAYLLKNRDLFTRCLTTKLLEYAAGREPSVGDRHVIEQIVNAQPQQGYGFTDLITALVQSEAFLTK